MSTDDRVRTFVNQLKVLVTASFQELFTMAKSKYPQDGSARVAVFHKCLGKIEDWDVSVRTEEMQRAMEQYPGIREDYRHAAVTFLRSLALAPSKRGKLPPFDMFLFYYYRAVARSAEMRQQQFFGMDYVARHAYFSDMLHLVLNSCVHVVDAAAPPSAAPAPSAAPPPAPTATAPAPTAVPAAPAPPAAVAAPSVASAAAPSIASAAAPPSVVAPASSKGGARAHPAWAAALAAAAAPTLIAYSSGSKVHDGFDGPILPSDSVSNVGRPSKRQQPKPALPPPSVARQSSVRLIDTSTASKTPPAAAKDDADTDTDTDTADE
jgi:hypothetical protein